MLDAHREYRRRETTEQPAQSAVALSNLVRRVRISRPIHIHLPRSPGAMYVNTHSTTQPSGRPLDRHTHRDSRSGAPGILEEGAYPVVVEGAPFPASWLVSFLVLRPPVSGASPTSASSNARWIHGHCSASSTRSKVRGSRRNPKRGGVLRQPLPEPGPFRNRLPSTRHVDG